jgi:uncharacterized hydrophobic protein (TIGR00271 family)
MLHLRVYGRSSHLVEVGATLEDEGAVRHATLAQGVHRGHGLLTAEVEGQSADRVLEFLFGRGYSEDDIALARFDDAGPVARRRPAALLIWADMVGQARQNSRPVARYLVFMLVAGVIAGFGVIYANTTLIVGAMAVSPDTLPVTAVCTGVVGRRWRLAGWALATLMIGLGASCLIAALLTAALDLVGGLPAGFHVGESALSGLATINSATIGVALAAGVAGVLALESRASSAVGVAISVTTIPAAAYLGVAAGVGKVDKASGALAVLCVNIAMLLLAGTATLLLQRRLARRPPPSDGRRRGVAKLAGGGS